MTLLDYGAGNVRSVRNAIIKLGFTVKDVTKPEEIAAADRLIFPGVGAYGSAMDILKKRDLVDPLKEYVASGKPFRASASACSSSSTGRRNQAAWRVSAYPRTVRKFVGDDLVVPHIGWNTLDVKRNTGLLGRSPGDRLYFVHSFRAEPEKANEDWVLATCDYGGEFVAAVQKGEVMACQFHPEKSGEKGIGIFKNFLEGNTAESPDPPRPAAAGSESGPRGASSRAWTFAPTITATSS